MATDKKDVRLTSPREPMLHPFQICFMKLSSSISDPAYTGGIRKDEYRVCKAAV